MMDGNIFDIAMKHDHMDMILENSKQSVKIHNSVSKDYTKTMLNK
jgi:hypothetical protein